MQGTRQEIIQILKERGSATVDELASEVGLASVTVRYHLSILEKEDLIASETQRGHVGRPYHLYALTEAAEEIFPKKYDVLAGRLLGDLKDRIGHEGVEDLFRDMADGIVANRLGELKRKSTEEKLDAIVELLSEEGFVLEWEEDGDEYVIKESNCPYYRVGQEHPEVCCMDTQVIATILDASVDRETWMVEGDSLCTFYVKCN